MSILITLAPALKCREAEAQPSASRDFRTLKYGIIVHYVPGGTVRADGTQVQDIDELAGSFDAAGFAADLKSAQVEYVIFTAWHGGMRPLYPSARMDAWRPGNHSRRDLIGDLLTALEPAGIRVYLYTHPYLGYHFNPRDQAATGWGTGAAPGSDQPDWSEFNPKLWNNFVNEIYGELVERYGSRIDGIFMDEGTSAAVMDKAVDFPRLRRTIKASHPDLLIIQNFYGKDYAADIGMKEYWHWGEFAAPYQAKDWPAYIIPVTACITKDWYSSSPAGVPAVAYSVEDMFRYLILMAGSNSLGGGVAWGAGPYSGIGAGWETGVMPAFRRLGNLVQGMGASLRGTLPSTSYPVRSGTALKNLPFGISATRSVDHALEFLHVLKPPQGKTLALPNAADGKVFASASLLPGGQAVALEYRSDSLRLTLPAGAAWDTVVTSIQLRTRSGYVPDTASARISDTDTGITYGGTWSYDRWNRRVGDYENDIHFTRTNGDWFQIAFTGTGISYLGPKSADQGTGEVYMDGVRAGTTNGSAPAYQAQAVLFEARNLLLGNHTLKVVKTGGGALSVDALEIFRPQGRSLKMAGKGARPRLREPRMGVHPSRADGRRFEVGPRSKKPISRKRP